MKSPMSSPACNIAFSSDSSEIVIDQEAAVVVRFEPMIKVDLIKVGSNHLFRHLVGLTAQEWNPESGQHSNQRLRDSIRIAASTSIGRLYFAQGGSNHQELMWVATHETKPIYENRPTRLKRVHEIRQVLALDHAIVFQSCNGIVAGLSARLSMPANQPS